MCRIVRHVRPLVRIGAMIVQFLVAIGIPDITPAGVANAEMLAVEGADDGAGFV